MLSPMWAGCPAGWRLSINVYSAWHCISVLIGREFNETCNT